MHRQFQRRFVDFARRHKRVGDAFNAITFRRSRAVASLFAEYLPRTGKLLDIGAGTGHVATILQAPGRMVAGCDVVNLLMLPLPYVIGDGGALPFRDGCFDATMLITVLHHVPKALHAGFLSEAARVLKPGGKLVVMEDTFHGAIEREATKLFDSVMNAEYAGHPHANRTLADWTELMARGGLHVEHSFEHVAWYGPFRMRHGILIGVRA